MQKKITITVEESVYHGLYATVGKGNISRFIESLVRPHLMHDALKEGYQAMALDNEREQEALQWAEQPYGAIHDQSIRCAAKIASHTFIPS